jgi:hypothetical protein
MKKIILVAAVLALQGCALINAYNMAKFDSNEYQLAVKVRTQSEELQSQCKDQSYVKGAIVGIYFTTKELQNYTQYIPNNPEAFKMSTDLVALTRSTLEMYQQPIVSEVFCKAKLTQISIAANDIQKVIGKKPR